MNFWQILAGVFNAKPAPSTPKPPAPTPSTPSAIRYVEGLGVMQPGDRQSYLTDAQIAGSSFIVPRERWKYLEPVRGSYDFTRLDSQIKRAKQAGKMFVLPVMTGMDCNPPWLDGTHNGETLIPWSSDLRDSYRKLHERLAAKYARDAQLGMVWITGPTIPSQEMHLNGFEDSPGFSSDRMLLAWMDSIDLIGYLYPGVSATLSISTQKPVKEYLNDVIEYAIKTLGQRAVFQINSLGTHTNVKAEHIVKLKELHARGFRVGAEMVGPGHTAAFGKLPEASFFVRYPQDVR